MQKTKSLADALLQLLQMEEAKATHFQDVEQFVEWTRKLADDRAIAVLKQAKDVLENEWRGRTNAKNRKREHDPLYGILAIDAWVGKQMSQRLWPRSGNDFLEHLAEKAIGPGSEFGGGNAGKRRRDEALEKLAGDLKDALDHPRKTQPDSKSLQSMKAARATLSDDEFDDAIAIIFDPEDEEKRKLLARLLQEAENRIANLSAETN